MLAISEAQAHAFGDEQQRRFVAALGALIQRELGLGAPAEQLSALIERANRAGLSSERDVAGFVTAGVALAAGAPDLPPDWIERRLQASTAPAPERVEDLVGAAAKLLQSRP